GGGETGDDAQADVRDGDRILAVLHEALRLEHPRRERRVRAEEAGADDEEPRARHACTGEDAEHERAAHVDEESAERELALATGRDRTVEREARDRADASDKRESDPGHRSLALRVSRVTTNIVASPPRTVTTR